MVCLRIAGWYYLVVILSAVTTSGAKPHDVQGRANQNKEGSAENGGHTSQQRSVNNVKEEVGRSDLKTGEETQNKPIARAKENTDNTGVNIMQKEAPLIKEVEAKIDAGKEMERNLTAIREAMHREISGLDETDGTARLKSIQMKKRLRDLDERIADLHAKNNEAQQRFRGFVGAIDSGEIRDEREARSALDSIYHFCGTVVAGAVRSCRSLYANVRDFFGKILGGIPNMFHSLLGSKWPSLKTGVNLLAGI